MKTYIKPSIERTEMEPQHFIAESPNNQEGGNGQYAKERLRTPSLGNEDDINEDPGSWEMWGNLWEE